MGNTVVGDPPAQHTPSDVSTDSDEEEDDYSEASGEYPPYPLIAGEANQYDVPGRRPSAVGAVTEDEIRTVGLHLVAAAIAGESFPEIE